jgi:hypothetical protein
MELAVPVYELRMMCDFETDFQPEVLHLFALAWHSLVK